MPGLPPDAGDLAVAPPLQRLRFVLVEPSHVGNIGASARAVRSMGFERLCVVRPRDAHFKEAPEALALAAGAADLLAAAQVHATLADALQGVQLAFATTGYAREFGPRTVEVREAAQLGAQAARACTGAAQPEVAFVFGPERTGLANADVQRCHYACCIPADPLRASLNLSQAVQVVAYECRRAWFEAADRADPPAPRRDATQDAPRAAEPAAGVDQVEAMFAHLEQGLAAVGYLDPQEPKHLMARLRRLLLRAQPSATEVDVLRGIASAMVLPRRLRAGAKSRREG